MVKAQAIELEALLMLNKGADFSQVSEAVNAFRGQFSQTHDSDSGELNEGNNWSIRGQSSNVSTFNTFSAEDIYEQQESNGSVGEHFSTSRNQQKYFTQHN